MLLITAPHTLLRVQLDELDRLLAGVRDADVESVHAARVGLRRIRELLPLVRPDGDREDRAVVADVRALSRSFGRVRELDVLRQRLAQVEECYPSAAGVAASARFNLKRLQRKARRTMIRDLERIDIVRLLRTAAAQARPGWRDRVLPQRAWIARLRQRIATHGAGVADAVAHAGGVYFPSRSHQTRIRVKKLRYSVEIAAATRVWQPPHLLKDLKRIQSVLGDLHDVQVLLDYLPGLVETHESALALVPLESVLEAEADMLHARYLARRERLLAIGRACQRQASIGPLRRHLVA